MGGKDDNRRSDLDKWMETQQAEINKLRDRFFRETGSNLDSRDDASSSLRGTLGRFKDFIDDNFNILTDGFKNFPSNVAELKARMQEEREARIAEERDIWRTWTLSDDSPDHIRMHIDRASKEDRKVVEDSTYLLLRESYVRNKDVSPQKILDLYQDNEWSFGGLDEFANPMLSFGGACYYKTETVDNLPSTARWGWPRPKPQWLSVDWFKRSPYSPVRIESDLDELPGDGHWRCAFEDLLNVTLDKPMRSERDMWKLGERQPHGTPQHLASSSGLDWMLSLQCRGILPPQLPSIYKPVSLFDGWDEVKRPRTAEFMHDLSKIIFDQSTSMYPLVRRDLETLMDEVGTPTKPNLQESATALIPQTSWQVPDTEQDLYDQMLPHADSTPYAEPSREIVAKPIHERDLKSQEKTDPAAEASKPDVLSQLTTTHTTRMPDGTVTTKVVLKQRFADGREEEHESVHTSHKDEAQPSPSKQIDSQKPPKDEKKKSGWFWS